VVVGLGGFILICWFTSQRHAFKGPTINLDLLNDARIQASRGVVVIHGSDVTEKLSMPTLSGLPDEAPSSTKVLKGE
jgi:hypothetical protein